MKSHALIPALLIACLGQPVLAEAPPPRSVIEDWNEVKAPAIPPVKSVEVNPKTTAFLVLDMQTSLVNMETRPRAVATVPAIAGFLARARSAGMLVVYSNGGTATAADIVRPLAPQAGDPIVRSGVDKFFRTDLEKILAERGITTVIITGTAANGAVLHTATGASLRGLKVLVPVDGFANEDIYAEQYTAWHMLNAPGTRANTTLTKLPLIEIKQ